MKRISIHSFPRLYTQRTELRQLIPGDANEIFLLRSDERVNRYLDRPAAVTITDAEKFIGRINAGIDTGEWHYWAIVPRGEKHLIGTICLWNFIHEARRAEIGFELMPSHQGKGIMLEVASRIINFAFADLELKSIDACLHADNERSLRILDKYKFMRNPEAELQLKRDTKSCDLVIYTLSR